MGQQQSLGEQLYQSVYSRDTVTLHALMDSHKSELPSACTDDRLFVQLIERQWDSNTINRFVPFANDRNLAILIASAVLHSHVVPIAPLFEHMREKEGTIEEHHLKDLYFIACERENMNAISAFIAHGCFNPDDTRPVRSVVRAQLSRSAVNEPFLKMILDAHPHQAENVSWIRKNCLDDAKNEEVRKVVDGYLCSYIP